MSIAQLFEQSQRSTLSDDQGEWRQFILDHLDYLQARSEKFAIEPELMNRYRYDLGFFLKDYFKRHEDIKWIVLLLNGIPSDLEFVDIGILAIPTDSIITRLYTSYRTGRANAKL